MWLHVNRRNGWGTQATSISAGKQNPQRNAHHLKKEEGL